MRRHLLIWSVAAACALLLTACCCCCCGRSDARRDCPPRRVKKACPARKACPPRQNCPTPQNCPTETVESVTVEAVGVIPVDNCGCPDPAPDCCQNPQAACCTANKCPCLQLKKPARTAPPLHGPVKTAPAPAGQGAADGK